MNDLQCPKALVLVHEQIGLGDEGFRQLFDLISVRDVLHSQLKVSLYDAVVQPSLNQLQLLVSLLEVGFGDEDFFREGTVLLSDAVTWSIMMPQRFVHADLS